MSSHDFGMSSLHVVFVGTYAHTRTWFLLYIYKYIYLRYGIRSWAYTFLYLISRMRDNHSQCSSPSLGRASDFLGAIVTWTCESSWRIPHNDPSPLCKHHFVDEAGIIRLTTCLFLKSKVTKTTITLMKSDYHLTIRVLGVVLRSKWPSHVNLTTHTQYMKPRSELCLSTISRQVFKPMN